MVTWKYKTQARKDPFIYHVRQTQTKSINKFSFYFLESREEVGVVWMLPGRLVLHLTSRLTTLQLISLKLTLQWITVHLPPYLCFTSYCSCRTFWLTCLICYYCNLLISRVCSSFGNCWYLILALCSSFETCFCTFYMYFMEAWSHSPSWCIGSHNNFPLLI